MNSEKNQWFERLKSMAETRDRQRPEAPGLPGSGDMDRLISDIQTYQIELEIQNEELRRSQLELEKSQDRFSRLFDMAPIGYVILDRNGFVRDANQRILDLLGQTRDDLLRRPFSRFVSLEDQKIFLARFQAFYKNPKEKILEIRLKGRKNNDFFSRIEGRFVELSDPSSNRMTRQLLLNVTDITESKRAELILRKSEAEHRHFLHSLNDAVICSNMQGEIVFFNACAEAVFNCRAKDVLGTGVSRFCPDDRMDEQRELIDHVLKNGFVAPVRTERYRSDGTRLPVEMSLHLSVDEQGRPKGFNAVIRDIRDRIKVEKEKERLIHQLKSALNEVKTLSGLLPICAHCKKIRNDNGYWQQLESYLHEHSGAQFSHSICRDCAKKYYPDLDIYEDE